MSFDACKLNGNGSFCRNFADMSFQIDLHWPKWTRLSLTDPNMRKIRKAVQLGRQSKKSEIVYGHYINVIPYSISVAIFDTDAT